MSNTEFLQQHVGQKLSSNKSGAKVEAIKKVTHLYLHDKYIKNIGNLAICENLVVLYLHNNEIDKIKNLEPLLTLKHLYLQKNKLSKIDGLDKLRNLRKLYLGCNEISVVEGLQNLFNLEELHIEKQQLNKGESLCFDPRTVVNLAETLQVLNISHNNITSIESLEPLKVIRSLIACYNNITDVVQTAKVIQHWYYLTELNFIGNPMTKLYRYKDTLIVNTFRLVVLDTKDINETTRSFIKRFEQEKTQSRRVPSKSTVVPKNLPGKFAPILQKAVSKSISLLDGSMDTSDTYLPWQALKPSVSDSGKVIPPLFAKIQQRRKPEKKKVHFSTFPELT